MRSEVYLRENLVALLAGVAMAHSGMAQRLSDRDALLYSEGFYAALGAVATALGISFRPDPEVLRVWRQEAQREGLLDDPLGGIVLRAKRLSEP